MITVNGGTLNLNNGGGAILLGGTTVTSSAFLVLTSNGYATCYAGTSYGVRYFYNFATG